MSTRIGFYLSTGALLGAIVGTQIPFGASYEAIAGGLIGVALAIILDKRDQAKKQSD